jgi:FkbM family methyltransferase
MNYKSQWSQDQYLNNHFFKNNKNGVFIDVGAHDGISGSNTYFFEKDLNWSGICFEPNPNVFDELIKNRNCTCLQNAVYNTSKQINFLKCSGYTEMLSGIIDSYDENHINRINTENLLFNSKSDIINVNSITLDDVIKEHNLKIIDYISIDTEGSEFEIISSINFNNVHINIINYEDNYPNTDKSNKTINLLLDNNFVFWHKIGGDNVFYNKNIKWSWDPNTVINELEDTWIFYENLDIIGNDIIYNDQPYVAYNTLGFKKHILGKLTPSQYYKKDDGIYIKNK